MYTNVSLIRKLLYAFHGQFMLPQKKKKKIKNKKNKKMENIISDLLWGKKSSLYNHD